MNQPIKHSSERVSKADEDPFREFFRLKKPCANCPFRKEGAIELMPGRLDSIIEGLLADDFESFLCHKTVNREVEDDFEETFDHRHDEAGRPILDGEKLCAGAAAYLIKAKRPTVGMRIALITGSISPSQWDASLDLVIDPPTDQ